MSGSEGSGERVLNGWLLFMLSRRSDEREKSSTRENLETIDVRRKQMFSQ